MRKSAVAFAIAALVLFGWPGFVESQGAETLLSMRRTILSQQQDRIIISVQARIGPISKVHGIGGSADCDVHVPLITQALFLPVLGEIKNACTMGPTQQELQDLAPGPMLVEGAFRIWFEGHDQKMPFREEDLQVPASYGDSNPAHLVEIHPITRVGDLNLLDHVRFIEKNGRTIAWKDATSFKRAVTTRLTVRSQSNNGSDYILMHCRCPSLANHYQLDAEIVSPAHLTDNGDGLIASAKILDEDENTIRDAVRIVAIKGTEAFDTLQAAAAGDEFTVYVLARLGLRPLLSSVTASERTIVMPIELILLHAEPR